MDTKMIGGKISAARKKIAFSQAQLADRVFVSPQAVGKWERGESIPDLIMLNRLAEILGVDLNYFSENFASVRTETVAAASLDPSSVESPSGKQTHKPGWNMSRGNWVDADFSGLKNLYEKFSSSNLQRCKFIGSDLSGLLLRNNHLDRCDFRGSDFRGSRIQNSHLQGNLFNDCSLREAEFSGSYLTGCDFTGADFTGAMIKSGGIEKSIFKNTTLDSTHFNDSHLSDIVFEGTLENCAFENCGFTRVTFQNATLKNTFFKCDRLKQLRFTNCQSDRMTYEFLKSGKADLGGITLFPE